MVEIKKFDPILAWLNSGNPNERPMELWPDQEVAEVIVQPLADPTAEELLESLANLSPKQRALLVDLSSGSPRN